MSIDLSDNYFSLFDLPVAFDVPDAELADRFRKLQRLLHPDRYAARPDAERRWSVQAASLANDAYSTLRRPLSRATYLLTLNGHSVDEETDTRMAPEFLMQQMEWREALGDVAGSADPKRSLVSLKGELDQAVAQRQGAFRQAADNADWPGGRDLIREWQFLDKLQRELVAIEARLDV